MVISMVCTVSSGGLPRSAFHKELTRIINKVANYEYAFAYHFYLGKHNRVGYYLTSEWHRSFVPKRRYRRVANRSNGNRQYVLAR